MGATTALGLKAMNLRGGADGNFDNMGVDASDVGQVDASEAGGASGGIFENFNFFD